MLFISDQVLNSPNIGNGVGPDISSGPPGVKTTAVAFKESTKLVLIGRYRYYVYVMILYTLFELRNYYPDFRSI